MNRYGQHCYTYILGWKSLDKWYYGARWANKLSPQEDLWNVYQTSSSHVRAFVDENGAPDVIRVSKIFDSVEHARRHENRFIARNKCVRSKRWLNKGAANGRFTHSRLHTDESKKLIGDKSRERWQNPEFATRAQKWLRCRVTSPETKQLLSVRMAEVLESAKDKWKTCPHCGKEGEGIAMRRWHFDNCRLK